jgi:effector-binding domain-containing protein
MAFSSLGQAAPEDALISSIETIGRTPSDLPVERVTLKSLLVALAAVEGKTSDESSILPKSIEALKAKLQVAGLHMQGAPLMQFKSLDDKDFTAELMLPVNDRPKEQGTDLRFGKSYEGKALRVTHKGSLESLEDAYFELETFVEDQGFDIENTMIERYLTDPLTTAPKDMVTEIYVPLK